ncbi:MAG: Wzz/FepE/Etk N-terminal domain-containing protein, partial [Pseudomonadota bacterium]
MSEENKTPTSEQPILVYPQPLQQQDEITLVDIVRILIKHKTIIIYTLLAFSLLGIAKVITTTSLYQFTSILEVGSAYKNANSSKLKLESKIIPLVVSNYVKENPDKQYTRISSTNIKDTKIIKLNSQAEKNTNISILHQEVIAFLIKENRSEE